MVRRLMIEKRGDSKIFLYSQRALNPSGSNIGIRYHSLSFSPRQDDTRLLISTVQPIFALKEIKLAEYAQNSKALKSESGPSTPIFHKRP